MGMPLTTMLFLIAFVVSLLTYGILMYVYFALSLSTIGKKLKKDNCILAWIPIANVIFALELAGRPWWWIFLFLIPIVNIIIAVVMWMDIAKNSNQSKWLGIIGIIPIIHIFLPGYLAYVPQSKKDATHPAPFIILIVSFLALLFAIGFGIGTATYGVQISQIQNIFSKQQPSFSNPSIKQSTDSTQQDTPACNHPNGDVEYWWWDVPQDIRDCYIDLYGEPAFIKTQNTQNNCTFPNGDVAEWWETVPQSTRDCFTSMYGAPQFAEEGGDVPYCDYDHDPDCWPPGEFPGDIDAYDHPNGDIEFW